MAIIPQLFVRNLDQAICFYRDVLGFELDWRERNEDLGTGQVEETASLNRFGDLLMLTASDEGQPKHFSGRLMFLEENVGELLEEIKPYVQLVSPLKRSDGLLQFTIEDSDGYQLVFATVVNETWDMEAPMEAGFERQQLSGNYDSLN